MPIVDHGALPDFEMRVGITGKWLVGQQQGAAATTVLSNTVEPGVEAPLHLHEFEEVILIEEGEVWVEMDNKERQSAVPGQAVIIPPRTPHAWGAAGTSPARVLFIWPTLEPFGPGKSVYLKGEPPAVR